jgi:hypothetical protein
VNDVACVVVATPRCFAFVKLPGIIRERQPECSIDFNARANSTAKSFIV